MFFRRSVPTETFEMPVVTAAPAQHTPELDAERAANLIEVSRVLRDAPEIARLALDGAKEICAERNLDFVEIAAGIPRTNHVA